jgi:hypothetical protein
MHELGMVGMSIIPALNRLKQEDREFEVTGLHSETLSQNNKITSNSIETDLLPPSPTETTKFSWILVAHTCNPSYSGEIRRMVVQSS